MRVNVLPAYAFNFLYKFTPQFLWALEFRRFETQYLLSGKQTGNHLDLLARGVQFLMPAQMNRCERRQAR